MSVTTCCVSVSAEAAKEVERLCSARATLSRAALTLAPSSGVVTDCMDGEESESRLARARFMTTVFACELTADGLVLRAGAGDSSVTLWTRSNAVGDLLRFDSILRCFPTSAPSRYSLLLRSAQTAQGLEPATLTASPVWVAQHITAFQVTPTPQFLDIVVNLKAGPSQELLEQSVRDIERDWLGPAGVSYRIHTTQGPGDAGRIGQSIIEDQGGREGSTRTIMVVGGDGTIHELLNGINLELAKVEVILMCVPKLS